MKQFRILMIALVVMIILYGAYHASTVPPIRLSLVASGLRNPVAAAFPDDGSGRMFVASQGGQVMVVLDGKVLPEPFLDISDKVLTGYFSGLLGIAVHPGYASTSLVYISYVDLNGDHVIARYLESNESKKVDPTSEQILLTINHPPGIHYGGHIAFGPDGYLYISSGDGSNRQVRETAQDRESLLGKILRIDVDSEDTSDDLLYSIPPDNPFAEDERLRGEIWLYGLRNPWRFSFDHATGDLYVADAGQHTYEEVNYLPAGSPGGNNMGWPTMEGMNCFVRYRQVYQECDRSGFTLPVVEYTHPAGESAAVIGGYVYRGSEIRWLQGAYLFGDFGSGEISITRKSAGWKVQDVMIGPPLLSSFAEDSAGEVYVIDFAGSVYKLVPTPLWDYLNPFS
jgi:glucose/arabinose dehydrogenase